MRESARKKDTPSPQGKGKAKGRGGRHAAEPSSASIPAAPPPGRAPRLIGWRKWVLRVGLMLLAPAVVLALLEVGLRLGGYGSPGEFLLSPDGGQTIVANEHFTCRFMPRRIATRGDVIALPARKAPGRVRIFVLGESAAMGIPTPAFSFGRVLERMLRQRWPAGRFEVVNAAVMGIDSHAMARIAHDCAAHEADLLVIYAGNNEMVGPCSPLMRMGRLASSRLVLDAWLWLRGTRTAQLTSACAEGLGAGADDGQPQTMEFFLAHATAAQDPRRATVREHFARNLADCCRSARSAGASVVLCTVATNLSASPPFASLHRDGLAPADLAEWQRLVSLGEADERLGHAAQAAASYRAALALDDRYAELHFRLGRCLAAAGDRPAARAHFARARDLDALPFRITGPLNDAVLATARQFQDAGVTLIDANEAFRAAQAAPGGLGDERLFTDHCPGRQARRPARPSRALGGTVCPEPGADGVGPAHVGTDRGRRQGQAAVHQPARLRPEPGRGGGGHCPSGTMGLPRDAPAGGRVGQPRHRPVPRRLAAARVAGQPVGVHGELAAGGRAPPGGGPPVALQRDPTGPAGRRPGRPRRLQPGRR
jgi:hypothetical protein